MTQRLAYTTFGLASLAALLLTGCCRAPGIATPEASKRCGAGLPVLGHLAQYTVVPGPTDGALIRGVRLCTSSRAVQAHHRIPIQGLGWRRFHAKARKGCKGLPATALAVATAAPPRSAAPSASSADRVCAEINLHAFLQDVHRGLKSAGVVNTGLGITPCCGGLRDGQGRFRGVSVRLRHWQYTNAAVRVVAQKVRQWGLAETVNVLVAPIPGACAL